MFYLFCLILGLVASFCVASVLCQENIIYRGFFSGQHYYSYNGQDYPVLLQHHEQFRTNPEAARQRFLTKIQEKFTSRFENVDHNADKEAATVNVFRPNKKNPQAVIFPVSEPQEFNPSIPFQTSFVPRIPTQQSSNSQNLDPFDLPFETGYSIDIPQRETQDRGNRAITEFAWRLFKGSNSQSDFVLSPLSPQILLSYLTWVAEGRTRQELVLANGYGTPDSLQKTVNSLLSEGSKRELQIATAFFISNDMR